ncbi:MAG: AAA family ATPase [Candidatus Thorarchaeota archaeon]|jgi:exonuclease SbcC
MRILSLELRNFKPFRDLRIPETGDLPDGLILIRGPNSTGKSSLFEAVFWGLWGADSALGLTNNELVSFTSTHCQVILVFEVDGIQYKIDRKYNSADGMSVVLYARRADSWKRVVDKSRSVADKLGEILQLQPRQALNTLLVKQGEVALIANATPTVLRNMLVKVYNIELLEEMTGHLDHLESDLKIRTESLEADYQRPEHIQSDIEDTKVRVKEHEEDLQNKKDELTATEGLLKDVPDPDALSSVQELTKKLDDAKRDLERARKNVADDLEDAGLAAPDDKVIATRLKLLKKDSKRSESERSTAKTQISEIDREIGALQGTERDLKDKISVLGTAQQGDDDDSTLCPTCSKPLSANECNHILAQYETAIKQGLARVKQLKTEQAKLTVTVNGHEDRILEMNKAIDAVGRIKSKQKDVDKAELLETKTNSELTEAIERLGVSDIDSLLKKHGVEKLIDLQLVVKQHVTNAESLKREYDMILNNISVEQKKIEELEAKVVRMEEMGREIETLKSLNEHAKYVRRKLVSGFLADYVIQKRLIGIIRGATNQYVRSFTNGQYTAIDLEPTPGRGKGGAGLALKISDKRDNAVKKTSQLSFGDRTAVSLALRLGISRTMSAIRPLKDSPAISPRVRSVLLDEPLGGLDKARRTSVVQNLINDQSFQQIFLITHTDVQGWEGVTLIDVAKSGSASTATLRTHNGD